MIRVVLIGGGNVAYQIALNILKNKEISLVQVANRSLDKLDYLEGYTKITNNISQLKDADIYIVAVSDDAIELVSKQLKLKDKLVVHTSGATDLDVLPSNCFRGVLYMPMTFSKQSKIDFRELPICIDSSTDESFDLLHEFSSLLSSNVNRLNYKQRSHLHAGAVFVNNFVNHLYYQGKNICSQGDVPFKILEPLIEETAKKIVGLDPIDIQTGPARRKDMSTINRHKEILDKEQKELYSILSNSIIKTYEKKL